MIPYIGDISKADASVLADLAHNAHSILEFGVGASTQVIAAYRPQSGRFISLDTDPEWINKTKLNLGLLELANWPVLMAYDAYDWKATFDFIFDDGVDSHRLPFALKAWPLLEVGGVMAFHDTRRWQDARTVCHMLEQTFASTSRVNWNVAGSNITTVYKGEEQPYVNWQESENRLPWQIGFGKPDEAAVKRQLEAMRGSRLSRD